MKTKTDFEKELLNTLSSLRDDEKVNPSVVYRQNTKVRLMNLITDEKKVEERKSNFIFIHNPKFAFRLAGMFLIILIFVSTGTILAAQSANPKNTLYPVKLASEDIALKLSPTPFKADIAVEIAKRRGDEITSEKNSDSKPEIKRGIDKYKESIDKARVLVPSNNIHLSDELKNEEGNLDELTRRYEDSGKTESQNNTEEKVRGASDFNNNSSEQKQELNNSETPTPIQQKSSTEKNGESANIQSSPSDSIEKTTQEIRNTIENGVRELTATPSPEEH